MITTRFLGVLSLKLMHAIVSKASNTTHVLRKLAKPSKTECRAEPNTVVMHIRMLDKTAQLQQEAVGVVGINFIHAAFTMGENTAAIIGSLLDELTRARVEVSASSRLIPD